MMLEHLALIRLKRRPERFSGICVWRPGKSFAGDAALIITMNYNM